MTSEMTAEEIAKLEERIRAELTPEKLTEIQGKAKAIAGAIKSYIDPVFDNLHGRIDYVASKIDECRKAQHEICRRLVRPGDKGFLWICKHPTRMWQPSRGCKSGDLIRRIADDGNILR